MLESENMSEAARNALIHSGIDEGTEDDILAHYGVEGMKWGRRKQDRTGRIAGEGRIATLKTKNSKPIVSVVKRTSPAKSIVDKAKQKSNDNTTRRQKLDAAYLKMLNDNNFDARSQKTKNLHKAQTITLLAALGTGGVGLLSRKPATLIGAAAVVTALSATSIGLGNSATKSGDNDVLKKYGN